MKSRRFYIIGLILSVVVFFGAVFIPESMADMQTIIALLCMACFIVFLIALIVSTIRAKINPKAKPEIPAPTPAPVPVTVEPIPAPTPTPSPAPLPTDKNKALKVERVHVRGVSYYTDNIVEVATENDDYNMSKRELIECHEYDRVYQYDFCVNGALVPEPDNKYDPNAIMVQADGLCIGHVPKGSTTHIRKLMESGRIDHMKLNIGGGKYKEVYEDEDGEYQIDKDELNYSAVLEIYLTDD